jgi:hypothetical protein
MLSREVDDDEEIWSLGEYVPRAEIEKAFKLTGKMPLDIGVAPHQPSPVNQSKTVQLYVSSLLVLLTMSHFYFLAFVFKSDAISVAYNVTAPINYQIKTDSFTISDTPGYVESQLQANVTNNWFETIVEVVNEDTGEEYEYDQGVEFYSGYDSDGSWTEGSRTSDRRIAKLAPGKYHLNITTNTQTNAPMDFALKISQGNVSWGNYLFALFLIGLFPLFYIMRSQNFEKSRWSQSDYSPYWSGSDD